MDMKKAWQLAKEKAEKDGGSSKDYIGEMMKKQWQEKQEETVQKTDKKTVKISNTVALRLDDMHKDLLLALYEKGDYKNVSQIFREAIRYLAARDLTDDEIIEIVMTTKFDV